MQDNSAKISTKENAVERVECNNVLNSFCCSSTSTFNTLSVRNSHLEIH